MINVTPMAAEKISIGAGAAVGFLLGAGDMQEADQYGDTSGLSIGVDAGVGYHVTPMVAVRADFRLTSLGLSFDGNGARSNPNMDDTVEVSGGRDTYMGGALALAVLY